MATHINISSDILEIYKEISGTYERSQNTAESAPHPSNGASTAQITLSYLGTLTLQAVLRKRENLPVDLSQPGRLIQFEGLMLGSYGTTVYLDCFGSIQGLQGYTWQC